MDAVIRELNVYPIKSAGGAGLDEAALTPAGLRNDREFMLVRPDMRHLSQREAPRMATLRPSYDGAKLTVDAAGAISPLTIEPIDGPALDVTVHGKPCQGVDQGDGAAAWFGALLGISCRLVRFTGTRPTGRGGGTVTYADEYPLLIISAESLDDLNRRLDDPLPMNRFRPSVVVEGLGPYGEDDVRFLRAGDVEIELIKPCGRCVITTTDQETGAKGHEPLRTLATYRTRPSEEWGHEVMFGRHAIPRRLGTLAVGAPVTVRQNGCT